MTYLKLLDLNRTEVDLSTIKPKLDRTIDNPNKKTVKKRKTDKQDTQIELH